MTASTINAGSSGLAYTSGTSGDMSLQTNGVDAVQINSAQQVTLPKPLTQPGGFSLRNKIINGNFDIWQRGTTNANVDGMGYLADRFKASYSGSTLSQSRQAFTLGQTDVPYEPSYFWQGVVTSSAGASNYALLLQGIEGVRACAGQTVTVTFYAKADASKNIALELFQNFGVGGAPSSQVSIPDAAGLIALTTNWQKVTRQFVVPSIAGKTLGGASDHFGVAFWFDAGSTFAGRVNSLGQQSGTFSIAQVQVEVGGSATTFELRPIEVELALCQRYYEKSYDQGVVPGTSGVAGSAFVIANGTTSSNQGNTVLFAVEKRLTPAISYWDIGGNASKGSTFDSAATRTDNQTQAAPTYSIGTRSVTFRYSNGIAGAVCIAYQWTANAEL